MRTAYEKGGPGVDLYDALNAAPAPMKGDVEFYLRQARKARGPVLELGVGTGRVAGPLHQAGVEIVGLDRSRFMLEIARRKFPGLGLVRGDMTRFDLGRAFRLITIPSRAFQHLKTPREQRACRTWRDTLSLRWTYRFEMRHLLELEGLEPVACYGDFREGPPKYGAEQIWIARRA